jgi:epoxyqueuosine reductase
MRPSPGDLTHQLKAEAYALGFELVGVTTPDPPAHMDVYSKWIASGRHGEMSYLESSTAMGRRQDPLSILPECKSILVVGINYQPEENPNTQTRNGKVATYALGDDYHMVIESKLRKLIGSFQSRIESPISYRIYTDTGPILERDFAQRAGLGWIGKNTCLINPKLGSYFLLGEALLSIQLEPDPPFDLDRCGSCSRCIDSCPTSCILPDRTIDSRRCISYLTIEKRGTIPEEYRDAIGDWLYGCDICQEVCPWNHRFSVPTKLVEFRPRWWKQ